MMSSVMQYKGTKKKTLYIISIMFSTFKNSEETSRKISMVIDELPFSNEEPNDMLQFLINTKMPLI